MLRHFYVSECGAQYGSIIAASGCFECRLSWRLWPARDVADYHHTDEEMERVEVEIVSVMN